MGEDNGYRMVECGNCGESYSDRCEVCPGCCGDVKYDELDEGIRETVRLLQRHGFQTTDSGDGATGTPRPWDKREEGHVTMVVDARVLTQETLRLASLLQDQGLQPTNRPPAGADIPAGYCVVEGSYNPAEGIAIIDLSHIVDACWYRHLRVV